jgi:AcrR family transcriptional regulator
MQGAAIQLQKDNIKRSILDRSKDEFFRNGFAEAKIRDIASACGISVGNIYNYFQGKNGIFHEIVSSTIAEIDRILDENDRMDYFALPESWGYEYHMAFVEEVARFIERHRENLKLIVFHSHGSDLEDYASRVIDRYTESMIRFLQRMKEKFQDNGVNVSEFFIHNLASFYINTVEELLMHDVQDEELVRYLRELMEFTYQGWRPLMNWYTFLPWTVE